VTANPYQYTMTNAANYIGISLVPDTNAAPPNIVITNEIDISAMTHFHVDFWTPDEASNLQFKLVDGGADGQINPGYNGILLLTPSTTPALATGHWVSCDVPIDNSSLGFGPGGNNFPGGNAASLKHFAQLVIIAAGGGHVYIDNLYFWGPSGGGGGGTPTAPTTAAPTPGLAASNVVSLYTSSHTYTNVPVDTWQTGWSVGTETDYTIPVLGNVVKKYTGLQYAGIDFTGTGPHVDAHLMTTMHLDVWTPDATQFSVKLVGFTGTTNTGEFQVNYTSTTITKGSWISLEIPLSSFTGVDLSNIGQILVVDNFPVIENGTFFIDNVYFHK
jgi:hypothetical protein